MTSITIYNFNQNQVRTEVKNFQPWFCLNDICNILDITDKPQLRKRLNERGMCLIPTPTAGGKQKTYYINEPNLYRCILKSDKPQAKNFENWICEEVLPQIRKTGAYGTPAETAPSPVDMRAIGGVVKKCANKAIADYFDETMFNETMLLKWKAMFKGWVKESMQEELASYLLKDGIKRGAKMSNGIEADGLPYMNWIIGIIHSANALQDCVEQMQQRQRTDVDKLLSENAGLKEVIKDVKKCLQNR